MAVPTRKEVEKDINEITCTETEDCGNSKNKKLQNENIEDVSEQLEGPFFSYSGLRSKSCVKETTTTDSKQFNDEPIVEYNRVEFPLFRDAGFSRSQADTYVSATATCSKYLALGFMSGSIVVLTHSGSILWQYGKHYEAVTGLSFDFDNGGCLGSCGEDGKVLIHRLPDQQVDTSQLRTEMEFSHTKSLKAIAVHPQFCAKNCENRMVAVGGVEGSVYLHTRLAFYTAMKVLHSGEGHIQNVIWHPCLPLISWTNDKGVKVLEVQTGQRVSFIPNPTDSLPNGWKPYIMWYNESILVTTWRTTIKIAVLRQRIKETNDQSISKHSNCWFIELIEQFSLPRLVCGLAVFDGSSFLLGSPEIQNSSDERKTKFISVLTCLSEWSRNHQETDSIIPTTESTTFLEQMAMHHIIRLDGFVVVSDCLPFAEISHPSQLHLTSSRSASLSYAISKRDVLQIKSLGLEDRVAWLVGAGLYEAAVCVSTQSCDIDLLQSTVKVCLPQLLESKLYTRAIKLFDHLNLNENIKILQDCVEMFDNNHALQHLIPILPYPPLQLSIDFGSTVSRNSPLVEVCENVLVRLCQSHPPALRELLQHWLSRLSVLNLQPLIDSLRSALGSLDALSSTKCKSSIRLNQRLLLECLGILLEERGMVIEAFAILLLAESKSLIFGLLQRHLSMNVQIQSLFMEELIPLMDIDTRRTVDLLVLSNSSPTTTSIPLFPTSQVVAVLQGRRQLLHEYLKAIFAQNASWCLPFQAQQIALFAEFEPECLLEFLQCLHRSGQPLNLTYALAVCRRQRAQVQFPTGISRRPSTDSSNGQQKRCRTDGALASDVEAHRSNQSETAIFGLYASEAFLLCHLGRHRETLDILVNRLGDVVAALQFVISSGDLTLWSSLMDWLMDSPEDLETFLNTIEENNLTYKYSGLSFNLENEHSVSFTIPVDPLKILKQLPEKSLQRIPNISSKLRKLLQEISEHETLLGLVIDATHEDYEEIGDNYVTSRSVGTVIESVPSKKEWSQQPNALLEKVQLLLLFSKSMCEMTPSNQGGLSQLPCSPLGVDWTGFVATVAADFRNELPILDHLDRHKEILSTRCSYVFPQHKSIVDSTMDTGDEFMTNILITSQATCSLCGSSILEIPVPSWHNLLGNCFRHNLSSLLSTVPSSGFRVFRCGHFVHSSCELLQNKHLQETSFCLICTKRFSDVSCS